jgi:hypothetical protein
MSQVINSSQHTPNGLHNQHRYSKSGKLNTIVQNSKKLSAVSPIYSKSTQKYCSHLDSNCPAANPSANFPQRPPTISSKHGTAAHWRFSFQLTEKNLHGSGSNLFIVIKVQIEDLRE